MCEGCVCKVVVIFFRTLTKALKVFSLAAATHVVHVHDEYTERGVVGVSVHVCVSVFKRISSPTPSSFPHMDRVAIQQAILPAGLTVRTTPPPPPEPETFEEGYLPPEHTVKPLQETHQHPNDSRLYFYPIPHIYTLSLIHI